MSTTIRGLSRATLTYGLVQISLDLATIDDALRKAAIAVEAGADWLEIGTPLTQSEGVQAAHALRKEFPDHPLVADLKMMDGGYGAARMYGDAGADAVVVMSRAHDAVIERACDAGAEFDLLVMADDMASTDPAADARRVEALGVGMVLHHLGHDHRAKHRQEALSPLASLPEVIAATSLPVQVVGGLSVEQAIEGPQLGAGVVVFGAPLVIADENSLTVPDGDLLSVLGPAIARVHEQRVVYPRSG